MAADRRVLRLHRCRQHPRRVEETLTRSLRGAFSPAAAFGADFALTIPDTTRIDVIPAEAPPNQTL